MIVNLKALIQKLNPASRSVLEGAANLCLYRTHYEIEIEHLLAKLLDSQDTDFERIAAYFGVDRRRMSAEAQQSMDRLKRGNTRTPLIGPDIVEAHIKAWVFGSIEHNATEIRTGHVVMALAAEEQLSRIAREFSREFQKIAPEVLRQGFVEIVLDSPEGAAPIAPAANKPAVTGGPHIFISYRRDDSSLYADYLFAALRAEVPDVYLFRDSDTLEPGMVFSEKIRETVTGCDILVALIGKKWAGAKSGGTRRIDEPNDWVRLEIATALEQKKWVIPCLVGGAKMVPASALPPDIAGLAERHAIQISHSDLRGDSEDLIDMLKKWKRGPA